MVFLYDGYLDFIEAITTFFSFDFDFGDIFVIKLSNAVIFNKTISQNLPSVRNKFVGL